MTHCDRCGTPVGPATGKFCDGCGLALRRPVQRTAEPEAPTARCGECGLAATTRRCRNCGAPVKWPEDVTPGPDS